MTFTGLTLSESIGVERRVQKAHQVFFDLLFKNRSCKLEELESIEALPGGAVVAVVRWLMGGYRRPNGEMRPPGRIACRWCWFLGVMA
jgi:hypothetical protein